MYIALVNISKCYSFATVVYIPNSTLQLHEHYKIPMLDQA